MSIKYIFMYSINRHAFDNTIMAVWSTLLLVVESMIELGAAFRIDTNKIELKYP